MSRARGTTADGLKHRQVGEHRRRRYVTDFRQPTRPARSSRQLFARGVHQSVIPLPFPSLNQRMNTRKLLLLLSSLLVISGCDQSDAADSAPSQRAGNGVSSGTAAAAEVLTPQDVARRAFPSTVLILTRDRQGQPAGLGSGFAIGSGLIATNFHVIDGAASAVVRPVGDSTEYVVAGMLVTDPAHDLAVLHVPNLSTPSLPFTEQDATIGDPVYVVGNPRGLEGTFSQGIVSGLRRVGPDSVVQITAPISPGSSGGPVLDATGKVIGIATATLQGGQNLNFAVPASYVGAALAGAGDPQPFGSQRREKTDRSFLDSFDGPLVEGLNASQFIWETNNPHLGAAFSFTVRNTLTQPVRNVGGIAIFYDEEGQPLTYEPFATNELIPPGLAVRIRAATDPSVKQLTTGKDGYGVHYRDRPRTKVEFRILTFEIAS